MEYPTEEELTRSTAEAIADLAARRRYQALHFGSLDLPENYWLYHGIEDMAALRARALRKLGEL